MNSKLIDLIARAEQLESRIAGRLEGAARTLGGSPTPEPLEIVHAIVDAAANEIQPVGRGRRGFPYNHIRVLIAAGTPGAKAQMQLACDGPPTLQERIAARLEAGGCVVPLLPVAVSYVTKAGADLHRPEFHLKYARVSPEPVDAAPTGRVELTVTKGTARQHRYTFVTFPVAIGRSDEVRDNRDRLIRTNQVAFVDNEGDDINRSVSRQHARIEQDVASGALRIYDDGSAQGTSIIRRGRGVSVPRGTKGMRLQSGDEIVLGHARLKLVFTMVLRPG